MNPITDNLPHVRGTYRFDAPLAKTNWFGVGGNAEVLFKPEDADDLAHFIKHKPAALPLTVIGVGSNLIIRDGGIAGVVIRLGRGFTDIAVEDDIVTAGAAAMDVHVANISAQAGRGGLEFLSGIPGTIGGALAMNAGAYGCETSEVLMKAEAVTPMGEIVMLTLHEMNYSYRHYGGPQGLIFTKAWFHTKAGEPKEIEARIAEIQASREASQPIRERTGGSTFKNPTSIPSPLRGGLGRGAGLLAPNEAPSSNLPPQGGEALPKAWQLIDAAGCRGLRVGGAQMSQLHCNFMINTGGATAADLEGLGEEVRARVKAHSGIQLEWEIRRVGRSLPLPSGEV